MNYTTKQIAEITGSQIIGDGSLHVKNIAYDSRTLFSVSDSAFLAINTTKNSGEKYIQSAIEKGIDIIISEHHHPQYDNITWIIVDNSMKFLQKIAKFHLEEFNLKTIGITGSNGKTIVKEWLYQSLFHDYATVKSPKSFNSQLGLPLSLLEINKKHQLGIFEVGISKPNEMSILTDIFSPQIGILTHIGSAHSSNFHSEEELIAEKIYLFKNSEIIIYNGDNELVVNKINAGYSSKKLISFGFKKENNVSIINDWKDKSQEVLIKHFNEEFSVPVYQRDEATISNVLCVISVLKEFGFDHARIVEKLKV